MSKKLDKKFQIYLAIVVAVFLIGVSLIYYFSRERPETTKEMPQTEKEKILTPEEIQEALSEKAEPTLEIQPLSEKQIEESFQKKATDSEISNPLSPEEIQKALDKKIE